MPTLRDDEILTVADGAELHELRAHADDDTDADDSDSTDSDSSDGDADSTDADADDTDAP